MIVLFINPANSQTCHLNTLQLQSTNFNNLETIILKMSVPWSREKNYEGYLLKEVLSKYNYKHGNIVVCSYDEYCINITKTEINHYNPVIANKANGIELTMRDDGPFFLLFNYVNIDRVPETPILYSKLVRHVKTLSWDLCE